MVTRSTWRTVTGVALAGAALIGYAQMVGSRGQAPRRMAAVHVPSTQIGINLGNPSYWSSEWAFADIVQTTGGIIFQSPAGQWLPLTDQVPLDPGGHPVQVPAGTRLNIMIQQNSPRLPTGTYDCRISKGWSVRPFGDWQMTGSPPRFRMAVTKAESRNGIVLLLTATSDQASLTDLSCVPAGGAPGIFNPLFLADLKPFKVLRFMDWLKINHAPERRWAERATPAFFSQASGSGVAIEHVVALANDARADPWINLPLEADAEYYRAEAQYVRDHLARDRRVYVELSNEVWNTSFGQAREASARGAVSYPSASPSEQNDFYYADRVRAAMKIWTEVFAGQEKRLVRVIATQHVNPRRAEQALGHADTWRSVDALATAPYFGTTGGDLPGSPGSARVDAIFARGADLIERAIAPARANKAIAARYGLRYIAYEGGADFGHPRPDLRDDGLAVQRDPRMYDLYLAFLRRWQKDIGDVLVLYNSVSTPGNAYYFGHREYTGQPTTDAPKARAVEDFARGL